ncbi:PIN domain-containing protein [Sphingomonas oryzagri]
MSSSTIIGIPTDEKVFESNCVPLFAGILGDPNVKLLGTRGKKQFGLDLIGRRDRDPAQPVGIQCKLITRGAKLPESMVRNEVAQALAITPPLTEFYIVTTATDEPALDLLAIDLCQQQAQAGRKIDIQVWGWDTLQDKIRADARALAAFDPDYSASTNKLIALGEETAESQGQILDLGERILQEVVAIRATVSLVPVDTERSALDQHLDLQIDQYRDLMNTGRPRTALGLLEMLEATLSETNSPAIRARVKANIAFARIRLGDEASGAELLACAYALNPGDPKVRGNYILALTLRGDLDGAWHFAEKVLGDDPTNISAAGLAFQVASMPEADHDPMTIVPADLLGDINVRIYLLSYLRAKSAPDSWWQLAAETLDQFPEDGNAIRMAGDALIDEALRNQRLERRRVLGEESRDKLVAGAALLQRHWEDVRLYENATDSNWMMVAYNLITACRALGDLDRAKAVVDQMLALGSDDPDSFEAAAAVAIDQEAFADAASLLRKVPDRQKVTLPLMVALSNQHDFAGVIAEATPERRAALGATDQQTFDTLVFRARRACDATFDLGHEVEQLLEAWPLGVAAHIAVADIYLKDKPGEAAAVAAKAKRLIGDATSYADRFMFAQLSMFRNAWDDVIDVLDRHVRMDEVSDELAWLALAFANAPTRPRTAVFFKVLGPTVIARPRFARLAGAAEHNRGDLMATECYLRPVIAADPSDLRAILLLASALARANREAEAVDLLHKVDDAVVVGSAEDLMRLAHNHRRAGETERALQLGYRVAITNRQNEDVMASYPGLVFLDEALPAPIGRPGPAQADFWFDLEGLDGTRDAQGIIDADQIGGVSSYLPDHPLAAALMGRRVGDEIVMPAEFGADRRYRVRELKHKYIWLLHDILATHAARFPEATSLVEMTVKEGDVQPILDMVRDLQSKDDVLADTYANQQVPLAAVAAMANKHVLALAEHLSASGRNLRTCVGAMEERIEAIEFVRAARGKGAVLDTLTVWQLRELGHLAAAKAYFGRLCIARSTFDEMLEVRAKVESNRGREFMTMGYDGEQAWRQVHTPEDTEAKLAMINAIIADIEQYCEVLPVDGLFDPRLERLLGPYKAQKIFDPIQLAKDQVLILVSEDMRLRQYAAQQEVIGGAWMQVVLHAMAIEGAVSQQDYFIAVGRLGAMRHEHLWLDARTLIGILTLHDPHSFALYEAAIRFMGGAKADMSSHMTVTLEFMRMIWVAPLPDWQRGRAIGRLLEQLTSSRPGDWKAALHVLNVEIGKMAARGDLYARRSRDYLAGWITGHFYDLEEISSFERVIAQPQPVRPLKGPQSRKARRGRKGRS